jgi:alcohol dehydrogenase (cytochrome c)
MKLFPKVTLIALLSASAANLLLAASGAGNDWTTPGGTVEGTRFSTLNQITTSNVATLKEEFSFSTGVSAYMEGQPLVANNTMFVVGPYPNKLFALDLSNPGHTRWVFTPSVNEFAPGQACCGIVNRGAAFSKFSGNSTNKDLVIYATLDNQVIGVDANTGRQVWRTRLGDARTGQTMTGPVLVVSTSSGDVAIVGNAGAELGVRGWVTGLNAGTGAKLWQYYNTGPDSEVGITSAFKPYYKKDQGTNLGSTTWPGNLYTHGGSSVWNWFTYDPASNLIFYGTSQPAPWNADMRNVPGGNSDNKWSSSIVARNPRTGAAVWAYQVTPHDGWDFDSISESIVATIPGFNNDAPILAHFDKNGFGYTMDAATGKVLVANAFVPVNWASSVDLTTGLPNVDPAKMTHEGVRVQDICPSALGGKNHHPAAFSPVTNLFYVPANNTCASFEALKVNYIQATPFMGASLGFGAAPQTATFGSGRLIAWDPVTGTEKWGIKENYPYVAGPLATQGNVIFYGTVDGFFKAVDATTGQLLFSKQYPQPVSGSPITFVGPDGKQRVAFYTGQPPSRYVGLPPAPAGVVRTGPGTVHVFKL